MNCNVIGSIRGPDCSRVAPLFKLHIGANSWEKLGPTTRDEGSRVGAPGLHRQRAAEGGVSGSGRRSPSRRLRPSDSAKRLSGPRRQRWRCRIRTDRSTDTRCIESRSCFRSVAPHLDRCCRLPTGRRSQPRSAGLQRHRTTSTPGADIAPGPRWHRATVLLGSLRTLCRPRRPRAGAWPSSNVDDASKGRAR